MPLPAETQASARAPCRARGGRGSLHPGRRARRPPAPARHPAFPSAVTLSAPIAAPPPAPAVPPLRLTGTVVAQFFRFRCERQLRYELVPGRERGGDVPRDNADPAAGPVVGHRPGMELLARAGRGWERR